MRLHGTGKFRALPNSYVKSVEQNRVVLGTVYDSLEETVQAEVRRAGLIQQG